MRRSVRVVAVNVEWLRRCPPEKLKHPVYQKRDRDVVAWAGWHEVVSPQLDIGALGKLLMMIASRQLRR